MLLVPKKISIKLIFFC